MQNEREKRIQNFKDLTSIKDYYGALGEMHLSPAYNFIPERNIKPYSNSYDFNKISFFNENVIETMRNVNDIGVLIFASAKNPGGGVLNGSIAQEESISYHSTWYFQAVQNNEFYLEKGASALNSDDVSIANGFMLTDINHKDIEPPKKVFFIGCAAPNKKGIQSQGLNITDETIYHHLDIRIEKILQAAEQYNVQNLILGAFGCGIFGLEPSKVAYLFKTNISKGIFSGNIIFSIMDYALLNEFEHIILHQPAIENKSKNKLS